MTSILEEKGTQLFARYVNSTSCQNIEKNLFSNFTFQDIIEIYGESGSGKTELLYHFIARCILPDDWKGLNLDGLDFKVIFIDNDCHFNLFRLISILETRLKFYLKQRLIKIDSEEISSFINDRIKLLEVIKCFESEQFLVTLCSLENLLGLNNLKTIIMIDGITSFYWCDKMRTQNQHKSFLTLYSQLVTVIKRISQNCKIPVFATRRRILNTLNNDKKILGQTWKSSVTHQLELTFKQSIPNKTLVTIFNASDGSTHQCGIGKFGFVITSKEIEKLKK